LTKALKNPILKPTTTQSTMTFAILTKLAETYPEVLTNPQSILGPNYPKVLEFWRFLDSLSDQDKKEISDRYFTLDDEVIDAAIDAVDDASAEVVGWEFRYAAWNVALNVTGRVVFSDATLELIGDVENMVTYDLIMSHKNS
jgi:hypothetical protein